MADYEDKDEVLIETEPKDSDFVEEHGDPVGCVSQKVRKRFAVRRFPTTGNDRGGTSTLKCMYL